MYVSCHEKQFLLDLCEMYPWPNLHAPTPSISQILNGECFDYFSDQICGFAFNHDIIKMAAYIAA